MKLTLPTITVDDYYEHIVDDDFFLVYGNPIMIVSDGEPALVVMSAEYARRLKGQREEVEKIQDCVAVIMVVEQYMNCTLEEAKKKENDRHD